MFCSYLNDFLNSFYLHSFLCVLFIFIKDFYRFHFFFIIKPKIDKHSKNCSKKLYFVYTKFMKDKIIYNKYYNIYYNIIHKNIMNMKNLNKLF